MHERADITTAEALVPANGVDLETHIALPPHGRGAVIFAHGSGSSRHSPRNRLVAGALERQGFATILMDLLTQEEGAHRGNVFDVELLAQRLRAVADWTSASGLLSGLPIGYFGASTGAAAALVASVDDDRIQAIVSRGGRPDLAGGALESVTAPTLLIVGADDTEVLGLNRSASLRLGGPEQLSVIPGATHLFEEPGTLEQVADLACAWMTAHLVHQDAPQ